MVVLSVEEFNKLSADAAVKPALDPEQEKIYRDKNVSETGKIAMESNYLRNLNRLKDEQTDKNKQAMTDFFEQMKKFFDHRGNQKQPSMPLLESNMENMSISGDDVVEGVAPIITDEDILTKPKKARKKRAPYKAAAVTKKQLRSDGDVGLLAPAPEPWWERSRNRKKTLGQAGDGISLYNRNPIWLQMPFS